MASPSPQPKKMGRIIRSSERGRMVRVRCDTGADANGFGKDLIGCVIPNGPSEFSFEGPIDGRKHRLERGYIECYLNGEKIRIEGVIINASTSFLRPNA